MNVFEKITESPEALASLLRAIPAIETPWDDAFHRLYCSSCAAADCDDCRRPERDSPLWWLEMCIRDRPIRYKGINSNFIIP